jgi:hypothetical protein
MIRPEGVDDHWEQTDLWRSAAAIPGIRVISDTHGEIARKFAAVTSGETLLYSSDGNLLFAGGITESRGHIGDNAGRSTIESVVMAERQVPSTQPAPAHTPVYGCPLFTAADSCLKNGSGICQK